MMQGHLNLRAALNRLPSAEDEHYATLFEHGTLSAGIYAPRGIDDQTPHTRDELYIVVAGSGQFFVGGESEPFGPGDVLFAPAGTGHRFVDFSDDLVLWVVFYGPEGGE
jgi:mannose-6-phosphate isomerase-like protein (cupin superfamily)